MGLGLINLTSIPGHVVRVARVLADSLAQGSCFESCGGDYLAFSVGVVISFSCLGFLFGYLFTRLFLASAFVRADLDSLKNTRETAEAASGSIESLRESLDVMKADIQQMKESTAKGGDQAPPESKPKEEVVVETSTVKPAPLPEPHYRSVLLDLAKKYDTYEAPAKADRVRARNEFAWNMAAIINSNPGAREWAVQQATREQSTGLIVGIATAINAEPKQGDPSTLFDLISALRYKHARFKATTAVGRLFEAGYATKTDIPRALEILANYYRDDSDGSLRRHISYTLAQISKATGQGVGITGL